MRTLRVNRNSDKSIFTSSIFVIVRYQFTSTTLSLRFQPLFLIVGALATGILLEQYVPLSRSVLLLALAVVIFVTLAIFVFRRSITLLIVIGFLLAGASLAALEKQSIASNRLRALLEKEEIKSGESAEIIGRLIAPPEPAPDRVYLLVNSERISQFKVERPVTGVAKLVLYLSGDQRQEFNTLQLNYGSRLRVLALLSRPELYRNPGAINHDQYLMEQGIDLAGSIKSPLLITNLGPAAGNSFRDAWLSRLFHWRSQISAGIEANFDPSSGAILKAVLLGNRNYLDETTQEQFKAGGTFHILVIAGLHIALLALILVWLTNHLTNSRLLRLLILLAILWSYAVMVGAQPPVVRATLIVTIAAVARIIFRSRFGINTISAAAIVLLAYRPSELFSGSFQLSFLTVFMVVLLAVPLLDRLRVIGEWRPAADRPYPPNCGRFTRWLAEVLFWREARHRQTMAGARMQYRLPKARSAIVLGRLHLQGLAQWAFALIVVSTVIQFGLLPVMALYFNRVTFVGISANIIVGLCMLAFLFSSLIFALFNYLGLKSAVTVYLAVRATRFLLVQNVSPLISFAWLSFRVPHYSGWRVGIYLLYFVPVCYTILIVHAWQPLRLPKPTGIGQALKPATRVFRWPRLDMQWIRDTQWIRYARHAVFVGLAIALFTLVAVRPLTSRYPGKLIVSFIDVGQGDAILVRFPQGKTMLVDSGGQAQFTRDFDNDEPFSHAGFSIGEAVVSRYLWSQGIANLDYIVATHGHADHIEGFKAVVKNFPIRQAFTGLKPTHDPEFAAFEQLLQSHAVPLRLLTRGDHLEIDGVSVEVLSPLPSTIPPITATNNDSVVLRLTYGERSILLTGDIEQEIESSLVPLQAQLRADVLKVPHHGSRTSSTQALLDNVLPKYAVIPVGEYSRFGHPHPDVVKRYQGDGISLFQTGLDGTVTVTTDGHQLAIETFVIRKPTSNR